MAVDLFVDEALLLYSEVLKLGAPGSSAIRAFKEFFLHEYPAPKLRGHSSRILDNQSDPVALRTPAEQDRITKLVQNYFA